MTIVEVDNFMKSVTYKPGFRYKLFDRFPGQFTIQLDFLVIDVLNPKVQTIGSMVMMHDWDQPVEVLRLRLINAIHAFEQHEIDEWLKIGGEYVNHPHPLPNPERP